MQNPELGSYSNSIPINTMYSYSKGNNIKWLHPQYKAPREYLDPLKQVLIRKYAQQPKGEKDKKYQTKRGFFMDYDLKIARGIPSSVVHGKNQPWDVEQMKKLGKHKKVDQKLQKNTYIQQIQTNQQRRKSPGIATYNLEKSIKEKQKQQEKEKTRKKIQQKRRFFHQDIEHVASAVPGVGNYCPHDQIQKFRQDKTDWKFWVQKHKKFTQLIRKRDEVKPSSLTYNPMNTTLSTFDRISLSPKGKNEKVQGFGSSARFQYHRVQKKKIKQIRPSPATYKTTLEWKGKGDSPKFKPWNTTVWGGKNFNTISIYNQ